MTSSLVFRWSAAAASALFLLLARGTVDEGRAELVISPANVVFDLGADPRPSGTIAVTNTGEDTLRYRVKAVRFQFSDSGSLVVTPPDSGSLASWLRFNPKELEVPPSARQVVRYTLAVPKQLKTGEYWGAIELEPLKAEVTTIDDGSGRTYEVKVVSSALIIMAARKGTLKYAVTAERATIERGPGGPPQLSLLVRNTGQGKVDLAGSYELADAAGRKIAGGELPKVPLMADSSRVLLAPLDPEPPPGGYVARLKLTAPQLSKAVDSRLEVAVLP